MFWLVQLNFKSEVLMTSNSNTHVGTPILAHTEAQTRCVDKCNYVAFGNRFVFLPMKITLSMN